MVPLKVSKFRLMRYFGLLISMTFCLLLAGSVNAGADAARDASPGTALAQWPLKDGDVWVMVGDENSRQRLELLAAAAYARYPILRFSIHISTAPGNSYAVAAEQFQQQIAKWNPTLVTVDLGANDCVTWYPHARDFLTNPGSPLKIFLDQTRACGARLILCSPALWDPLPTGADRSLMDEFLLKLHGFAVLNNVSYVDPYTVEHALQRPPVIGGTDAGAHLLDAAILFKQLGGEGLVSSVIIDAPAQKLFEARKARVHEIVFRNGSLRFTRLDESLPFPIPTEAREALKVSGDSAVGGARNLFGMSRYLLTVTGLPKGTYVLAVDGETAALVTAEELANGYNVGMLLRGPTAQQGRGILTAIERWDSLSMAGTEDAVRNAARPREHHWSISLLLDRG